MKKSTVHLFVFDTMSDWEYGHLIAGINNPQFQLTPGKFRIRTVALMEKSVTTMGGLQVMPELTLARLQARASAMLVLPGGSAWDKKKNKEAVQVAAEFIDQGIPVAAICGATAGLARAGLLDSIPHTSNSQEYIAQTGYQGGAFYREAAAVKSGNVITASAMHPLEFARDAFSTLGIYAEEVLLAWYNLYKTGDAKYFAQLMKAMQI